METSLNDGVYDNRGNAVQNVSHQPLLMGTNEMYTNKVVQYQTADPNNSVYEIKEAIMKTSETELTQTQQYYYSQSDQQNKQTEYGEYVIQQQTEATYIQQQTETSDYAQDQFLQISNVENEQEVTQRPEEVAAQYVETSDSNFGSQYEAEKHQEVVTENVQIANENVPQEDLQNEVLHEETLEPSTTIEENPEDSNAAVVQNMVEEVIEEQVPESSSENLTEEPSTVESQTECSEHTVQEDTENTDIKNEAPNESPIKDKEELDEQQQVVEETVVNETVLEEPQIQQEDQQLVQETDTGSVEMLEEVVDDPAPAETSGGPDPLQVQEETAQEPDDTSHQEDQSAYMSEIREEANSRLSVASSTSSQGNRRSTRRTYQDMPLHLVGHSITKPGENQLNGKPIPKPRLGVKVPYWNLSSQMLSKAEIEKEILERSKVKQEQASSANFARSLTQRLFKKIADNDKPDGDEEDTKTEMEDNSKPKIDAPSENSKIKDDCDLLAILEGDDADMPELTKEKTSVPQVDEANLKALEREIALQQLEELPLQSSKRHLKRTKTITSSPETQPKKYAVSPSSSAQDSKSVPGKENSSSPVIKQSSSIDSSPKKEIVDVEPQVRVNMVLKTYSRKRKADDTIDTTPKQQSKKLALEEAQVKKEDVSTPQGVYITKSSRVIKKKVIWDPDDEVSSRSPKPSKSADFIPASTPKPTTEKPAEKKPSSDKQAKKAVIVKKDKPAAADTKTAATDKRPAPAEKKHVAHDKKPASSEKKYVAAERKVAKSSPKLKPKKPMSELDKLLMDEGAVKMLYELKNNDESTPSPSKKQKNFVSVEKAQKEIMKKANEIKNDLVVGGEGAKSLRKKEASLLQTGIEFQGPPPAAVSPVKPTLERKMSKDSVRSSVHTPPPSPFMHSHSSMLIRRRSSSSISSSDDLDSDAPRSTKRRKSKRSTDELNITEKDPLALDARDDSDIDSKTIQGHKLLNVKKSNKQVSVELNYPDNRCLMTEGMLDELTTTVKKYSKDKDCSVLCMTSTSKAFCLGLDYPSLVLSDEKERKNKAANLADKVRYVTN
ncbi:unnamed protein product [Acanthoscelides obtectus]|uniref:Uncharacterized protein n=1 Tax=Acanthoscelides obtectus TaxID=200917 RepID=A0A9P0P6L5_ACAOB|nr:unnamed protein product [Acanthoscelides obtectus]CAK1647592.1 hypothetical protein AOBTE_LOCUS15289 [Acanthoscelides obtectus]